MAIGYALSRGETRAKKFYSTILPFAALVGFHHATSVPPVTAMEVRDAVVINAPPEVLWKYIVTYPVNDDAPQYVLWKMGLPMPTQSTATASQVGAARECRFTKNIVFKEKITALKVNEVLEFDITEQPADPEILGHFQLDKGKLELIANADGTTTLVSTSWYRLFVSPAAYFNWWAEDIVREVHFRVMGHMKKLAEAEHSARNHD